MPVRNEQGKKLIQSVVRTLKILNCFEQDKGLQIAEISNRVGIGKSTAHHLLMTLKEMQFVKQDPQTKAYSLGIQVFKLGYAYFHQMDLVKAARPFLQILSDRTKETVHLAELLGDEVLYLDKIESLQSIVMRSRIGSTKPVYCTGLGKALLAWQKDETLKQIVDRTNLQCHTDKTIVDKNRLLEELRQYRRQGYSIDDEEIEIGLFCVAAPVFDISGNVVAAVSISCPKYRTVGRLDELIPLVIQTARDISNALGQTVSMALKPV
jgi:DNA-binding IclR family transcriptional regulator